MASSELLQNLEEGVTYVSSELHPARTSTIWEMKITDFSKTANLLGLDNLLLDMDIGGDRKLRFSLSLNPDRRHLDIGLGFSGHKFLSATVTSTAALYIDVESLDKTGIKKSSLLVNKHVEMLVQTYLLKTYIFTSFDARQDTDIHNLSSDPANKHYIFRVNVTHCDFNDRIENESEIPKTSFESRFLQQMKDGFYGVNKHPDVTLISSDLMEHGAHKFMLAARSPILAKTIEEEVKKEAFKGKIKLDIGAKPLVAILHWMYTGELHEKSGKCMKDVVAAAVKYELSDLLKLLDKELITLCENENMAVIFSLFEIAKEYEMENARKEVGRFIRKNLPD